MISFSKYHGCGNSFIIVRERELHQGTADPMQEAENFMQRAREERREALGIFAKVLPEAYGSFAKMVCDPATGVGADGLIIVREEPALEMIFFNCDGSRAPMCGNGIRCFAHYCCEENICTEARYPVKTLAGDMTVNITNTEPFTVKINMGKPVFEPAAVGVDYRGEKLLNKSLVLAEGNRIISSLFMGTVHTMVFTDNLDGENTESLGREICEHSLFKEKTNVNFVEIIDEATLRMRTYERGVGMTLACGTGACASAVVANLQGKCLPETEVKLPLGSLAIEISGSGDVYMEGPSVKVCQGIFMSRE